jgi:hypothetical protein
MTNRQNTVLNMSLIPLFLLVLLIIGAGFLLLQGEIKLPKFSKGPQIRRLEGFPTIVYTGQNLEKQRRVIKTEEELTEFLNYIDETGLVTIKEKIDFSREHIIAVSTETEQETGYEIKVRRVYEDKEDNSILVSIAESELPAECEEERENDPNVAVDIVAMTKTTKDIKFERIKKDKSCE